VRSASAKSDTSEKPVAAFGGLKKIRISALGVYASSMQD
jgi:hypothetical protein